ncbi:MAG: prolyl-tRNA synthetase associated domain-containing protein [Clostridia bacterium]|nr:prolyl-tRNA synthetase associated domain-containing protein [Clostridia bacterium]
MTVFTSRPDLTGHLEKEVRVYDFLEKEGITYEGVEHPPAKSIDDCQNVDRILSIHLCKNLFLCNRQETEFYLLMMPGEKQFKTKDLSAQIQSSRLSFASADYMEKFLDITPGSVSVFGLMNDKENQVKLLIDQDLLTEDYVGCHPCINTASLKIKTSDLLDRILPAFAHEPTIVTL